MSLQELSKYTFQSRYSQFNHEKGRKETWEEAVERIFDMHREKYADQIQSNPEIENYIAEAERGQKRKKFLSSQRALQVGGPMVLKRNERIFNCTGLAIDKPKAFQDVAWLLLAGCGVGFSVQKFDVQKLPKVLPKAKSSRKKFVVPDSCEGWADAVGVLLSSYFEGGGFFPEYKNENVVFDFSEIRPKGSLIANQFKAPGPEPLQKGLEKIEQILEGAANRQLKSIEVYDILMHIADFVVSSGLRRSATICLFDVDDLEMAAAKTGDWFVTNPQRGRSNNSAVVVRDQITREQFNKLFQCTRIQGEPGVVFVDKNTEALNPCAEIRWDIPRNDGDYCVVGQCNLTDINGKYCNDEESFYEACRLASIAGTLQAGYTNFPYLGTETENFSRKESLLGVSITGWMDNPDILFDKKILEKGAKIVKETNSELAPLLGINCAARLTCSKPAGHTSAILKTSSGIHPNHSKRYIRRVQSNTQEPALQFFERINPQAVEDSVWSSNKTDKVISFLCEVPKGSILKNQMPALELLKKVKLAQQHWVNTGTNKELNENPSLSHSVSNTITVKEEEWDDVEKFIFDNREFFGGISLLPASGDLDYPQAPFSTVLTPNELVQEYGDASVFASGLVVDGLAAFDNNLWAACDTALGIGEEIPEEKEEPTYPSKRNYKDLALYFQGKEEYDNWFLKKDWIRRLKQFADRYFEGDLRKASYCCKHVSLWKTWCDLQREYNEVPWEEMEAGPEYVDADTLAAQACSGGKCEVI